MEILKITILEKKVLTSGTTINKAFSQLSYSMGCYFAASIKSFAYRVIKEGLVETDSYPQNKSEINKEILNSIKDTIINKAIEKASK